MWFFIILLLLPIFCSACSFGDNSDFKNEYGIFLDYSGDLTDLEDYRIVVIDAQNCSKADINAFKKSGHIVYTYLNIGSLEEFRPYYDSYKDLSLGEYAGWEDEVWIDVSSLRWQDFVLKSLVPKLRRKNIDGFFVDNCDVYYYKNSPEIFKGLCSIMEGLSDGGEDVIINGGDTFVDEYSRKKGSPTTIACGINQESVFTNHDSDNESKEYFMDYIERYSAMGMDIYLTEYTSDKKLINEIKAYCQKNDFLYFITDKQYL